MNASMPVLNAESARKHIRGYAAGALLRLRLQEALNALSLVLNLSAWLLVVLILADKLFSLKMLGIDIWPVWGGLSLMFIPYVLWRVFSPAFNERCAAVLADDRLGLHARISSAITLDPREMASSPFGQAFLGECLTHLSAVKVQQAFPVRIPRSFAWIPLPALAAAALFYFVPNQDVLGIATRIENKRRAEERQKQAAKVLEGRLEDLKKTTEQAVDDPKANSKLDRIMQKTVDAAKEMKDGKRDPEEVMLTMAALKHETADEKEKIEQGKSFLDRLEKLQAKDLNLEDSALTKAVSDALKMGDPGLAAKEMRKLAQKVKEDILNSPNKTDEQKKQDLDRLKGELEKLASALNEDKELSKDLYQIAKSSMNAADFEKLQDEVKRQLQRQNKGNNKLGDDIVQQAEQAAEELERLEEDNDTKLDEKDEADMEKLDEVENSLDEAIENLTGENSSDCKNGQCKGGGQKAGGQKGGAKGGAQGSKSMRARGGKKKGSSGASKAGEGEAAKKSSQGQGQGNEGQGQKEGQPGQGLGGGPGQGSRPYKDGENEFERQKAKGELRAGAITGVSHFRGQGAKGDAPTEFVRALEAAERESSSSLELERIPADAREVVKDYFSKVREGANLPQPAPGEKPAEPVKRP